MADTLGRKWENFLCKIFNIPEFYEDLRVSSSGDIYLISRPLKERYFKIAEESGMKELEDCIFKNIILINSDEISTCIIVLFSIYIIKMIY